MATLLPSQEIQLKSLPAREAVLKQDCWNVEALFPSWQSWEEGVKIWGREASHPHWPELLDLKGCFHHSPQSFKYLLDLLLNIDRQLSKLYTYAHLRHDEDVAEEVSKNAYGRILALLHAFRQESAWIEPEILSIPDQEIQMLMKSEELKEYQIYIEKILRMKAHSLSSSEEELLALAGRALGTASQAFGAFNNADLKFPSVKDSTGKEYPLTHGSYLLYLKNPDRVLRENAFRGIQQTFRAYENTLCELLNGQVQKHLLDKKARKYKSCVEAALYPNEVDTSVYTSLIKAVKSHLPKLHKYMALRKKMLGVAALAPWDLHVPLVKMVQKSFSFEEGAKRVVQSVAILGKEYQSTVEKGLLQEGWVDRFENARKRSGAYSSGCYDSMPYILMNYQGTLNDVMTLTHEAGHSMHSLMSRRHQPYQYSQYAIFVAEVASTFHEELLFRELMKEAESRDLKAWLINQKLDDIRATLIRQTLFAEFEQMIHTWAEEGIPLTPALLKSHYLRLNQEYFGEDFLVDEDLSIEWARIPHFYYNFYVYQYATGISAAHVLCDAVCSEGESAVKRYLSFLSTGGSLDPISQLKRAGVDVSTPKPVEAMMSHFEALTTELALLLEKS